MNWFYELNPIVQALLATVGTWLVTALGPVVATEDVARQPENSASLASCPGDLSPSTRDCDKCETLPAQFTHSHPWGNATELSPFRQIATQIEN